MTQDDNFVKIPNVLCVYMTWLQSLQYVFLDHGRVISYLVDMYFHVYHVQNAATVTQDQYLNRTKFNKHMSVLDQKYFAMTCVLRKRFYNIPGATINIKGTLASDSENIS